jgi:hypothetical protein
VGGGSKERFREAEDEDEMEAEDAGMVESMAENKDE